MTPLLSDALEYARAGFAVFPLRGKVPIGGHGHLDATTDTATITTWWRQNPTANIGVRPPAGVVVLDVDPRHGGDVALAELQARHGDLPATWTARTGGGGLHLWFGYHGAARATLAAGIDVKTCRGYVVAPPSVHPDTGQRYAWLHHSVMAPAPGWVRRLLCPPPRPPRPVTPPCRSGDRLAALVRFVAAAPEGELNRRLYWACCRAAESTLDTAPLVAAAVGKGHPARPAERTAASAAHAPARQGGQR